MQNYKILYQLCNELDNLLEDSNKEEIKIIEDMLQILLPQLDKEYYNKFIFENGYISTEQVNK